VIAYVQVTGRPTRVGFVCGRRVGRAVVRNRGRRLLKEAWRSLSPRVRHGFDLVVVARPEIRGTRLQDVREDLAEALTAGGVMDA
jgi:ribonuclease P protein component